MISYINLIIVRAIFKRNEKYKIGRVEFARRVVRLVWRCDEFRCPNRFTFFIERGKESHWLLKPRFDIISVVQGVRINNPNIKFLYVLTC